MTTWTDRAGDALDVELRTLTQTCRDEAAAWMDRLLLDHHPDEQAPVYLDLMNMTDALRMARLFYRQGVLNADEISPDLAEIREVVEYLGVRRLELIG